jgi:8-oxo-dGTP pyrophosphatase MutT (NUDIX family)
MYKPARIFEVSVKAFIINRRRLLLLEESDTNQWELPGGRVDVGEEHLAPVAILERELKEELGSGLRVTIGAPLLTWVRLQRRTEYIFVVGFLCSCRGRTPLLSREHSNYKWVDAMGWRALDMAPGYNAALRQFFWGQETGAHIRLNGTTARSSAPPA